METYITDYVTRGGVAIEIELPLGSNGKVLSRKLLTDSERRRLVAIQMQADTLEVITAKPITLH